MRTPEMILEEIRKGSNQYAVTKGGARKNQLDEQDEFLKTAEGRKLAEEYRTAFQDRIDNPAAYRSEPEPETLTKHQQKAKDVIEKINGRVSVIQKSEKLSRDDALAKLFKQEPELYEEYRVASQVSTHGAVAV